MDDVTSTLLYLIAFHFVVGASVSCLVFVLRRI